MKAAGWSARIDRFQDIVEPTFDKALVGQARREGSDAEVSFHISDVIVADLPSWLSILHAEVKP